MYTVPKDFLTTVNTTLHTGETYKGYSSLCAVLNEPKLYGNSKTAQLKEWSRYFTVNQHSSYSWEITSINTLPTVKTNSKYLHLSTALWSNLLQEINHTGEITIAKKVLYNYMGIPNPLITTTIVSSVGWDNIKQYLSLLISEVRYKLVYTGLKEISTERLNSYKIINEHGNYRVSTKEEQLLLNDIKAAVKKEYYKRKEPTHFNLHFNREYTERCIDTLGFYGIPAVTVNVPVIPVHEKFNVFSAQEEFRKQMRDKMTRMLDGKMDAEIVIVLNNIYFPENVQTNMDFTTTYINDKTFIV